MTLAADVRDYLRAARRMVGDADERAVAFVEAVVERALQDLAFPIVTIKVDPHDYSRAGTTLATALAGTPGQMIILDSSRDTAGATASAFGPEVEVDG